MKLGARLRQLRKERRFTLMDVSEHTGLSVSFLSEIEREQTKPSLETLEKLAMGYQLTGKELLEDVDLGENTSTVFYPPGFTEFLDQVRMLPDFDEIIVDLMLKVEQRASRRAETMEDWRKFYYSLRTILGR